MLTCDDFVQSSGTNRPPEHSHLELFEGFALDLLPAPVQAHSKGARKLPRDVHNVILLVGDEANHVILQKRFLYVRPCPNSLGGL